jgi:hypothetical protein
MLTDAEYTGDNNIYTGINPSKLNIQKDLHLSVSVRSYRSEKVSEFIKNIIDNNKEAAKILWTEIKHHYPIYLTRNIDIAKKRLKQKARGSLSQNTFCTAVVKLSLINQRFASKGGPILRYRLPFWGSILGYQNNMGCVQSNYNIDISE